MTVALCISNALFGVRVYFFLFLGWQKDECKLPISDIDKAGRCPLFVRSHTQCLDQAYICNNNEPIDTHRFTSGEKRATPPTVVRHNHRIEPMCCHSASETDEEPKTRVVVTLPREPHGTKCDLRRLHQTHETTHIRIWLASCSRRGHFLKDLLYIRQSHFRIVTSTKNVCFIVSELLFLN